MASLRFVSFSSNVLANRLIQSSNLNIISDNTNIYLNSALNATNIGGTLGLYLNTSNATLNFKSLGNGSFMSFVNTTTTISINSTNIVQTAGSYISISANGLISNLSPDQTLVLNSTTLAIGGAYPSFTLNYTGNLITYSGGSYISLNGGQINNTAPDQVVTLIGNSGIQVGGTYPSYTVSINLVPSTGIIISQTNNSIYIGADITAVMANTPSYWEAIYSTAFITGVAKTTIFLTTNVATQNISSDWTTLSTGQYKYLGTYPKSYIATMDGSYWQSGSGSNSLSAGFGRNLKSLLTNTAIAYPLLNATAQVMEGSTLQFLINPNDIITPAILSTGTVAASTVVFSYSLSNA